MAIKMMDLMKKSKKKIKLPDAKQVHRKLLNEKKILLLKLFSVYGLALFGLIVLVFIAGVTILQPLSSYDESMTEQIYPSMQAGDDLSDEQGEILEHFQVDFFGTVFFGSILLFLGVAVYSILRGFKEKHFLAHTLGKVLTKKDTWYLCCKLAAVYATALLTLLFAMMYLQPVLMVFVFVILLLGANTVAKVVTFKPYLRIKLWELFWQQLIVQIGLLITAIILINTAYIIVVTSATTLGLLIISSLVCFTAAILAQEEIHGLLFFSLLQQRGVWVERK